MRDLSGAQPIQTHDRAAELALRCAWLRAHAWEVDALDPSGQLAAQLRDFADLLEHAEQGGWWDR